MDFEKMKVINRSPAYKNKFVHRRDSVSLAGMTEAEITQVRLDEERWTAGRRAGAKRQL